MKNIEVSRKILLKSIVVLSIIFIFASLVSAIDATFIVDSFSCTPSEVAVNSAFSCTATIRNSGDVPGSVTVATLYPDTNWLEEDSYAQASGTLVGSGQTTSVTFSGLRATTSGTKSFLKIMLDNVEDNEVADTDVNVIDVIVSSSNSVSSAVKGETFDVTATINAGGDIDVSLTFGVDSGGCSIGSQDATKTISGMHNGNTQSRTWNVEQGTSGDCSYTLTALATGDGGVASKTDTTSSSVDCSDCSDGGDGGNTPGGGGGSGSTTILLGAIKTPTEITMLVGQQATFTYDGKVHSITLISVQGTQATISLDIPRMTFTLDVEGIKEIDLNGDGKSEISIKLKSLNLVNAKATLIISPSSAVVSEGEKERSIGEKIAEKIKEYFESVKHNKVAWLIIGIGAVILIIIAIKVIHFYKNKKY